MNLTNKKELPLAVLKEIEYIRIKARAIAKQNEGFIKYEESNAFIFQFTDVDLTSSLFFTVSETKIERGSNRLTHYLTFFPKNRFEMIVYTSWYDSESLFQIVNTWLVNVKEYSQIHLSEQEQIDANSEKEIYDLLLLDFVDSDAETSAFDLKQQLFLDNALSNVEATLTSNKEEYSVTDIIGEVNELRNAIPNETKKTIGKRLSKILVATKKHSISLFKEVLKEFLKDAAKWGIESGFHRMIGYFQ